MRRHIMRLAALLIALALLTGCGAGEYVSCASVGKYDSKILTNSILQRTSSLPNATEGALPMWRGAAVHAKSDVTLSSRERSFSEADVLFLSRAGMNFLRLELDFSTLQYPAFPDEAELVNTDELRELDRLLSWCMQYDIHLCIAMSGLPAQGKKAPDTPVDIFANSGAQATVAKYWKMLARRYSPIPSRNLSFCLISSPKPPSAEVYADTISPIVNAIWTVSPSRVVMADVTDAVEAEAIASLGVSLSYSFTVSSSQGGVTAAESWFDAGVRPIRAVAKERSVGMMIGSLGIVAAEDMGETYYTYYEEAASCINENGLGWCLHTLSGPGALLTEDGAFTQSGALATEITLPAATASETRYYDARLFTALTGRVGP